MAALALLAPGVDLDWWQNLPLAAADVFFDEVVKLRNTRGS